MKSWEAVLCCILLCLVLLVLYLGCQPLETDVPVPGQTACS